MPRPFTEQTREQLIKTAEHYKRSRDYYKKSCKFLDSETVLLRLTLGASKSKCARLTDEISTTESILKVREEELESLYKSVSETQVSYDKVISYYHRMTAFTYTLSLFFLAACAILVLT